MATWWMRQKPQESDQPFSEVRRSTLIQYRFEPDKLHEVNQTIIMNNPVEMSGCLYKLTSNRALNTWVPRWWELRGDRYLVYYPIINSTVIQQQQFPTGILDLSKYTKAIILNGELVLISKKDRLYRLRPGDGTNSGDSLQILKKWLNKTNLAIEKINQDKNNNHDNDDHSHIKTNSPIENKTDIQNELLKNDNFEFSSHSTNEASTSTCPKMPQQQSGVEMNIHQEPMVLEFNEIYEKNHHPKHHPPEHKNDNDLKNEIDDILPSIIVNLYILIGIECYQKTSSSSTSSIISTIYMYFIRIVILIGIGINLYVEIKAGLFGLDGPNQAQSTCSPYSPACPGTILTITSFPIFTFNVILLYYWLFLNPIHSLVKTHRHRILPKIQFSVLICFLIWFITSILSIYSVLIKKTKDYKEDDTSTPRLLADFSRILALEHDLILNLFILPIYYVFAIVFYAETLRLKLIVDDFIVLLRSSCCPSFSSSSSLLKMPCQKNKTIQNKKFNFSLSVFVYNQTLCEYIHIQSKFARFLNAAVFGLTMISCYVLIVFLFYSTQSHADSAFYGIKLLSMMPPLFLILISFENANNGHLAITEEIATVIANSEFTLHNHYIQKNDDNDNDDDNDEEEEFDQIQSSNRDQHHHDISCMKFAMIVERRPCEITTFDIKPTTNQLLLSVAALVGFEILQAFGLD